MNRRSNGASELPPMLILFLMAPWYVGPIVASVVYVALRWFVPWMFPLPTAQPKAAADVAPHLVAAFAQAGPGVAPIAAVLIMFAWLVAELLKLVKRMGSGKLASPTFSRRPGNIISTGPEYPVSVDQTQDTLAIPNRRPSRGNSGASYRREAAKAAGNRTRQSVSGPSATRNSTSEQQIDISKMNWKAFEELLVQVLRRFGFQAEHTGRNGPDGGIDVRCKDSRGETILVQCKHWQTKEVGVATVREFFGVLIHEGAERGLIVTSGLFTQEAKAFAENKPLRLVDGEKLLQVLAEVPASHGEVKPRYRISHLEAMITSEKCPRCASRMIRKSGRRGVFLSCERYPTCDGSRDV